jgi:hypothetical protein
MRVLLIGLSLLCASVAALGATRERIMQSRYLRTQFCIERAIGQRWHERYGIRMVINRWGISEPTLEGLAQWPKELSAADARCRQENEISNEPRPLR